MKHLDREGLATELNPIGSLVAIYQISLLQT